MKGVLVMILILAGYSLIYAGVSHFTTGITFSEGTGGSGVLP